MIRNTNFIPVDSNTVKVSSKRDLNLAINYSPISESGVIIKFYTEYNNTKFRLFDKNKETFDIILNTSTTSVFTLRDMPTSMYLFIEVEYVGNDSEIGPIDLFLI